MSSSFVKFSKSGWNSSVSSNSRESVLDLIHPSALALGCGIEAVDDDDANAGKEAREDSEEPRDDVFANTADAGSARPVPIIEEQSAWASSDGSGRVPGGGTANE